MRISVWALVTRHERFADLEIADFKALEEALSDKVKCHGYVYVYMDGSIAVRSHASMNNPIPSCLFFFFLLTDWCVVV